jgi:hypothetical protein
MSLGMFAIWVPAGAGAGMVAAGPGDRVPMKDGGE